MQDSKTLVPVVFAVAMFIVGVWFFRNDSAKKLEEPPRFLQCTECPFEKAYVSRDEDKICPNCKEGRLAPATQSSKRKAEGPVPFYRNRIALGLIVTTIGMAVVYIYLTIGTRNREPKEVYLHCRCKTCRRRLKYVAMGVPRAILFPTCRTQMILPPVAAISS